MRLYSNETLGLVKEPPITKYYKYGNKPNILTVGSLTDNNGVISGFSSIVFGLQEVAFYPGNKAWEFVFKIRANLSSSANQMILSCSEYNAGPIEIFIKNSKFTLALSSNGTTGDIADSVSGTYTVLTNTDYWLKLEFTGTAYNFYYSLDGIEYVADIPSITSSTAVLGFSRMLIGIDHGISSGSHVYQWPFLGSIDLKNCSIKIDNELLWNGTLPELSTSSDYDFIETERSVKEVHNLVENYYKNTDIPNCRLVGNLTNNNGVVSGFSVTAGSESYCESGIHFYPGTSPWEIDLKIRTGSVGTLQYLNSTYDYLYGPNELHITADNHFGFNIYDTPSPEEYDEFNGTYTVLADTDYWLRYLYTGTHYQLWYSLTGEEDSYVLDVNQASSRVVLGYGTILFGLDNNGSSSDPYFTDPFLGSIDFNQCSVSIGGNEIWHGTKIEGGTPSDYDFSKIEEIKRGVKLRTSSTEHAQTNIPNVMMVGTLTDNNGVVSGFGSSAFCIPNTNFYPSNKTWEMNFKITTGSNVTTRQFINSSSDCTYGPNEIKIESTKFSMNQSSNGSSGTETTGTYTVLANTTYWLKYEFTGSNYNFYYSLDGETYVKDITATSSTPILGYNKFLLGIDRSGEGYASPFLGSIDFNECNIKINDQVVWEGNVTEVTTRSSIL